MVGPESEKQAAVRHMCRLFILGGHLTTPLVTVVLRKGYGLGAQAMAAGSFHNTSMTLAWPSGEFGAMGLEGAVKIAMREVLDAIEDPAERQKEFDSYVASAYASGTAINTASMLEVDEVIDPLTTREAVKAALLAGPLPPKDGWINARRTVGIDARFPWVVIAGDRPQSRSLRRAPMQWTRASTTGGPHVRSGACPTRGQQLGPPRSMTSGRRRSATRFGSSSVRAVASPS